MAIWLEDNRNIVGVVSNSACDAIINKTGKVTTNSGLCDSSSVASGLAQGIVQVVASYSAFAAISTTGKVTTWGFSSYGGDSSSVASELAQGIVQVVASSDAFAAISTSGKVTTWGGSQYGGIMNFRVQSMLQRGVAALFGTPRGFVKWHLMEACRVTEQLSFYSYLCLLVLLVSTSVYWYLSIFPLHLLVSINASILV